MNAPTKPFPSYKWRWLSVTPSEGLLKAPVFLGVLRALQKFEGESYSSSGLRQELERVRQETGTAVNLARTTDRNLFRNSGQYWRGTGLVASISGEIELTALGRRVAAGQITRDEFAALMVSNTVLPNPATYNVTEMQRWQDAGLRIKPLELTLSIMAALRGTHGGHEAYLTPNELISVVIPLAGVQGSATSIARAVYAFRKRRLDVSGWPDCVPAANDKRLAREFLLFLENFGICHTDNTAGREHQRFHLGQGMTSEIQSDAQPSFLENHHYIDDELVRARDSEIPAIIERTRTMTSRLYRPQQPQFRKDVLRAGNSRCLLTQERIPDVLEAAHIIPVDQGGTEHIGNGLCLRVDVHRLYDSGKIRIEPNGTVRLNGQIEHAVSYARLPRNIDLPSVVHTANLEWRARYL